MNTFVILSLCSVAQAFRDTASTDFNIEASGNPYACHMFENFEHNFKVFNQEQTLVRNLALLRTVLENQKSTLLAESNPVTSQNQTKKSVMKTIEETCQDFPTAIDFQGALNGMVLLHDTYQFDIPQLLNGTIDLPSYPTGEAVKMQSPHQMRLQDFAVLATHAFAKTWYDVAISFLQPVIASMPKMKMSPKEESQLKTMVKNLVRLNNGYITKTMVMVDKQYKVLPYVVNDKLQKKKKQPKKLVPYQIKIANYHSEQGKEYFFRRVCNGFSTRAIKGSSNMKNRCFFLHHFDPYLKLGPFKYEVASESPFIIVFHDILTELEMTHMVTKSKPNLSRSRKMDEGNVGQIHEFKSGKKRKIIQKTVQHWIDDVIHHSTVIDPALETYNNSYTVMDRTLFKLSKKLELATGLNITSKYASTPYQVTNYGLGGLCETHVDPHGYLDGNVELPPNRKNLIMSGDMIGTVMAWINDEPVGGATAFIEPYNEVTVWPTKGSAAFWFSLQKSGKRDVRTVHGGCPVLKGSKWIMNKWIYYFDQVQRHPCSLNSAEFIPPFDGHY